MAFISNIYDKREAPKSKSQKVEDKAEKELDKWRQLVENNPHKHCETLVKDACLQTHDEAFKTLSKAYDDIDAIDGAILDLLYAVDALGGYNHAKPAYKSVLAKHDLVRRTRQGVWALWEALTECEDNWPAEFEGQHQCGKFTHQRWLDIS